MERPLDRRTAVMKLFSTIQLSFWPGPAFRSKIMAPVETELPLSP